MVIKLYACADELKFLPQEPLEAPRSSQPIECQSEQDSAMICQNMTNYRKSSMVRFTELNNEKVEKVGNGVNLKKKLKFKMN